MFDVRTLREPIVQAPLAGGPSTPQLAVAVSEAGGLGFLAAGYRPPDGVAADIAAVRDRTREPVGVNLFVPSPATADPELVREYARSLEGEARAQEVALGEPRHDDDWFAETVDLVCELRPSVASFTFGCPPPVVIDRAHEAGIAVWVTVTKVEEARIAAGAGADALVAQGIEAGGHRGGFGDHDDAGVGLLALLRLIGAAVPLPLIASGAIADGAAVAAVLCAGAAAAQVGTALMLAPEAGTSDPQRRALASPGPTRLTRAFTGRLARGIANRFMDAHEADAPSAYPEIHHVTSPVRAAARGRGDADSINLWAGQAHELAQARPAAEIVREMGIDARRVLALVAARLEP
jgi:nitronate monooxygenase